jgi:3-hydroxyisobutyrate dehydrogenase-like beta-hydroxyacid dehydrogenase
MTAQKERIGFVGLGLMGQGMATNILQKGWPLTIRGHRNRKPIDDLTALGATEADSLASLARASDIVFLCPASPPVSLPARSWWTARPPTRS